MYGFHGPTVGNLKACGLPLLDIDDRFGADAMLTEYIAYYTLKEVDMQRSCLAGVSDWFAYIEWRKTM